MSDLPNLNADALPGTDEDRLFPAERARHAPQILLL